MIEVPPFDALALSLHHSPGVTALLVGSGLSRSAGIPTGWEITLDLIRRLAALDGVASHEDWAEWYRGKYGKEPNYSEILDALASTQAERRAIISGYIEGPDPEEPRKPTKAHHAIAQLVVSGAVKVVITTNFDRLIENALRDAGIEPTVIASDDAVSGAVPLVHTKCTVIKVHGDYLDARIKNTDAELESYSPGMNKLLDQVFDNFGLLSVGWSGEWDSALRLAIQRAPSRRYPFYWAIRGSLGALATDLLNEKAGRSFEIADADSFFHRLNQTLKALAEASQPHPVSVDMAISLAKKYCRDDRYALEWTEFLHEQMLQVRQYLLSPDFPSTSPTNEILNEIVGRIVAKTEILRRSALVCGRWGTIEANQAVAQVIQDLVGSVEPQGGYTYYIELRKLAGSFCFYWNLAGLCEKKQWQSVRSLFYFAIINRNDPSTNIVSELPFMNYELDWRFLHGLEKHHMPMSDFAWRLFAEESSDISLTESRAENLFDKVEIWVTLGSTAWQIAKAKDQNPYLSIPFGRFIWKRHPEVLEAEMQYIEGLEETDPIFRDAVFGKNRPAAMDVITKVRDRRREIGSKYLW